MTTRQKKKEAFTHVMENVLGFSDTSSMMLAMNELEYDSIEDIVTMDKEEVMKLSYEMVSSSDTVTIQVPMKSKKKLLHVLWWRDHEVSIKASKLVTTDDWMQLTEEEFDLFVDTVAANMARSSIKSDPDATSTVTVKQVNDFQRGHKRDLTVYKAFNGDRRMWFMTKRNWHSNAANDGIKHLMNNNYIVPPDGTLAKTLFEDQNQYFYNVLQNCVKGGQGLICLRKYELSLDGRKSYLDMLDFYERKENLTLIQTQCNMELSKMRLDRNYQGGPQKFFLAFQNIYLDLENCTGKIVPDEEKIGTLNAAMEDSRFNSVRTTIETLALQTKTPIDYASYLQSLITHAENLKSNTSRTRENNKSERSGGRNNEDNNNGNGGEKSWKKDFSAWVPIHEFKKLSKEEKDKRTKARAAAKRAREAQARHVNALQAPTESQVTPPCNTMVPYESGAQMMMPVQAGNSNYRESTHSGESPTIREIMKSQTKPKGVNSSMTLPPGVYTDQNGRQFQINAIRRLHISNLEIEENKNLCLIDGGSNNGLAGAGMRLYEMAEYPERVDIIGASDNVQDEMKGLPIGTYCAVVTSATGIRCLGLFHNYVGYCQGKSILSTNQSLAYGVKAYAEPRRFGGKQKIVTNEEYVFKLKYKGGLTYLPLEFPSDQDINKLPHVDFCSPGQWNPDEENDGNDDEIWFESMEDEEELSKEEFLDSRDGWFLDEIDLEDPEPERTVTSIKRSLVLAKVYVSGLSYKKKPWDYNALRPYFGWKPVEVIKHTMAAATQYAKNVMRLPMRRHFKSRFPALRVRRLDEVYATDTYYSSVKAHDGSTCVQIYCGRKSMFTDIFGMKTESQMPGTLMDFIRKWGAMNGLFSYNAKAQTSLAVQDILR